MSLTQQEINKLFDLDKYQVNKAAVEFPFQGEGIEIELSNDTQKIKFIADLNRGNKIVEKVTFQLRNKKTYIIRRLDLNGSHKNPPAPVPDSVLIGYEDYVFRREDHVHLYMEGYQDRWALPLSAIPEIGIAVTDDLYEKMYKFFKYCHVIDLRVNNILPL